MAIDSALQAALLKHCIQFGSSFSSSGSSCIKVEPSGKLLFGKVASPAEQVLGEAASLQALRTACEQAGLNEEECIVPRVYGSGTVDTDKDGRRRSEAYLITDYLSLSSRVDSSGQATLGRRLALMHSASPPEHRYGFDVPTHCGVTEQDNTYERDWRTFWERRRIGNLVERIGDQRLSSLQEEMQSSGVYDLLLDPVRDVRPSCIHGDLWSGNAGTDKTTGEPMIFESSYYGHGEAELGMTKMFGGFTSDFYDAYHKVLPRSEPHYEERLRLYELYHHLNHALMFGGSYKSGAVSIMEGLIDFAGQDGGTADNNARRSGL
ncbi:unnamed protein product [Tilletia controversa]|uniref:protein-ribulosamine 3-kinase n=2 Tax=Tilletia TaxID=13289 RepID=A0A8T8TMI6_9BASI|nr:hypothetical protein CF336_g1476 [Tilletia laevis]KAE8262145.1 hypothetical protein A4X03_0g2685 [Tilletia caries]CAD6908075.1 unnamed protein product [Tilletia controversa]KAE8207651.1 hypothetical protein CF335_g984 [Tilletia laevis]CAD6885822.1 unnamed protein product [Tilletia caries]